MESRIEATMSLYRAYTTPSLLYSLLVCNERTIMVQWQLSSRFFITLGFCRYLKALGTSCTGFCRHLKALGTSCTDLTRRRSHKKNISTFCYIQAIYSRFYFKIIIFISRTFLLINRDVLCTMLKYRPCWPNVLPSLV